MFFFNGAFSYYVFLFEISMYALASHKRLWTRITYLIFIHEKENKEPLQILCRSKRNGGTWHSVCVENIS